MAITRGSTGITAPRQTYRPEASSSATPTTSKVKKPAKKVATKAKKAVDTQKTSTKKAPATSGTGTSGPGRPKGGKPKANTSAPRVSTSSAAGGKTKTGRVEKKSAAGAAATKGKGKTTKVTQKRTPTMKDKVEGAIEKAVGVVTGKTGKKVRGFFSLFNL